jgi:hypothetical protein
MEPGIWFPVLLFGNQNPGSDSGSTSKNQTQFWSGPKQMINCRLTFDSPLVPVFLKNIYIFQKCELTVE